ncbi:hypothetical protein E3A20_07930 [Planctomyces bekefii]|uniref:Uncharacterized protein n=1 Tax=Planctomyces bekefii TaxID=1653850 RepID=A0A5C6MB75_9PLAN|nr:hypothetical protein E3A20_07930 [Planctomyces bekefii]
MTGKFRVRKDLLSIDYTGNQLGSLSGQNDRAWLIAAGYRHDQLKLEFDGIWCAGSDNGFERTNDGVRFLGQQLFKFSQLLKITASNENNSCSFGRS